MRILTMRMRSLPAKICRRLLTWAEDMETGRSSRWRRHAPDCYQTIKALSRMLPSSRCQVVFDVGAAHGAWVRTLHAFYPMLRPFFV